MDIFKKKQKKAKRECDSGDTAGDAWIYTCIKRGTYFFVSFAIGKRTQETCRKMIEQMPGCFGPVNQKAVFYSDGNDDYTVTLPDFFPLDKLQYGQLIKIRENGKVVKKIKKSIYGMPSEDDIETTDTENFNGIMRERIGRLVRKTKCHSKLKRRLEFSVELFRCYWNFMDTLGEKKTPAMLEGISECVFSWNQFFYFPIRYP